MVVSDRKNGTGLLSVEKTLIEIVIPAYEPESMPWIPGQARDDGMEDSP